jgi:hypothetical protein
LKDQSNLGYSEIYWKLSENIRWPRVKLRAGSRS